MTLRTVLGVSQMGAVHHPRYSSFASATGLGFHFLRVARSCNQTTSGLLGVRMISPISPSGCKGGVVRASTHFLISACQSANENPQA